VHAQHDTSIPTDVTAKVEQMMQGVIVVKSGAVQPRNLYRMLFEHGMKDQHLRCSLHRILSKVF
jgi:hypothetical protein